MVPSHNTGMGQRELPIYELENDLVAALGGDSRVILEAPTGSGKSTQVPQILRDRGIAGDGQVVVLQPRRLATRMLAARVAQERGVQLGAEVGYQIRLDNVTSAATRIRYVTEGVLLRQMLHDPSLQGISVLIFDEFHERHLYGDITLARALDIQETGRPDLKIVVMSATLETGVLKDYLAPCRLLRSEGRTFPVEIEYLARAPLETTPIWETAAGALDDNARTSEGDVLIFMPGSYEIHRTITAIRNSRSDFLVFPLHGELSPTDQDAAVARYDQRKVIVSTNVAETSLTIDGVRTVIDSGLARVARFDPHRGIDTLLIEKISRASADQRAGRAGRTAPGRCIRLWRERDHLQRAPQELPEVKRLDLAEVVLTLKASGVPDIRAFRWLEHPDPKSLDRALTLLTDLGALDAAGDITPVGRQMLTFPVHPRYARMFLEAERHGCIRAVALIAALTQGRSILQRAESKRVAEDREDMLGGETGSDFFVLMRAWRYAEASHYDVSRCRRLGIHAGAARQVKPLFEQFLRLARQAKLDVEEGEAPPEAIERCVLSGFADQVARRLDAGTLRCDLVHGRRGTLARESAAQHAELFVAADVREIEGRELTVLLNLATEIKEDWLREQFPDAFREETTAFYDATNRRVAAETRTMFRDLVLRSSRTEKIPEAQAAELLAEQVDLGNLTLNAWDGAVEQWILRVNCLRAWMPDLDLPPVTPGDRRLLLEQICHGASSYREIKDRPVAHIVKSWLSPVQQQVLDKHAPERIALPNGRKFKITYAENTAPFISVRIQDLYGVERSLAIAAGRIPLVIHVLAPNHRPIQVTQDLVTFWKESYPRIKQELQRKYPKHEWR